MRYRLTVTESPPSIFQQKSAEPKPVLEYARDPRRARWETIDSIRIHDGRNIPIKKQRGTVDGYLLATDTIRFSRRDSGI